MSLPLCLLPEAKAGREGASVRSCLPKTEPTPFFAGAIAMTAWEIHPYTGVGALQFGLDRARARSLLGSNYSVFRRGPYATNDTDAFDDLGLYLEYDRNERLDCIEAVGECPISYKGITLLNSKKIPEFQGVMLKFQDVTLLSSRKILKSQDVTLLSRKILES